MYRTVPPHFADASLDALDVLTHYFIDIRDDSYFEAGIVLFKQ